MDTVRKDLVIQQGATFYLPLTLEDDVGQPVDLAGASARMQGRRRKGAAAPVFDWSSAGGEIVIDEEAGSITIEASTAGITGRGVYDLELTEGDGVVARIMEGVFETSREVTRE